MSSEIQNKFLKKPKPGDLIAYATYCHITITVYLGRTKKKYIKVADVDNYDLQHTTTYRYLPYYKDMLVLFDDYFAVNEEVKNNLIKFVI